MASKFKIEGQLELNGKGFKQTLDIAKSQARSFGKGFMGEFKELVNLQGAFKSLGATIGGVFGGLALTSIASKTISVFKNMMDNAKQVMFESQRTDLSVEMFQRLRNAAEGAGGSFDDIYRGMLKVNEAQQKILNEEAGFQKTIDAFAKFGVTMDDLKGKEFQDIFIKMFRALDGADPKKMAAFSDIMGDRMLMKLAKVAGRGLDNLTDQAGLQEEKVLKSAATISKALSRTAALNEANFARMVMGIPGLQKLADLLDRSMNLKKRQMEPWEIKKQQTDKNQAEAEAADIAKRIEDAKTLTEEQKKADDLREKERTFDLSQAGDSKKLEMLKAENAELEKRNRLLQDGLFTGQLDTVEIMRRENLIRENNLQIKKNAAEMLGLQPKVEFDRAIGSLTARQKVGAAIFGDVRTKDYIRLISENTKKTADALTNQTGANKARQQLGLGIP